MNSTTVSHIWLPHGGLQLTSGEQTRLRIALSYRAVRSNPRLNSACNLHADAEIDDSIRHLAPPWGSAVDFGGAETLPKIALSFGAVRSNLRVKSGCNLHANYARSRSEPSALQLNSGEQRIAPESRSRTGCPFKSMNEIGLQFPRRRRIRRQYHTSGSPMGVCN